MARIPDELNVSMKSAFAKRWQTEMLETLNCSAEVQRAAPEPDDARLSRLSSEYASTPCAPLSSLGVRKAEADEAGTGF